MNFPTEISDLEADLRQVLGMCTEHEQAMARSTTPQIEGVFLGSLNKLRLELERRLRRAKAESGTTCSA